MIVDGRLVSPETVQPGQVVIEDERIVAVGAAFGKPDYEFDDDCWWRAVGMHKDYRFWYSQNG